MSVPLRAADTGHTWLSTQNVAAPRRGWRVYNAISLSSDPCCCVARARGGCAQSWQHPHGPTPALLQVADRPRSARAPEDPTPAPSTHGRECLPEGQWRLQGGPQGDPGTQTADSVTALPSLPAAHPYRPAGGSGPASLQWPVLGTNKDREPLPLAGVATGPEPHPSTRQLTQPWPWATRMSGKRTGVLTGMDSGLGARGDRTVKPTVPGTPPEKLWGPLPSTHGGSRRPRGAREAW